MSKPPKYINAFDDRHGHKRYYFRFRSRRWPIVEPWTEGFATAYEKLLRMTKEPAPTARSNVAFMRGSLGWVIEQYLASGEYRGLAETTQRNQRRVLDILKALVGTGLIKDLRTRHCKDIRNRVRNKHTTAIADQALGLLSTLCVFAEEALLIDIEADPTIGVRRVHTTTKEHEPWPQNLIEAFLKSAPRSLRLAILLLLYTGQRRSDVVKMTWDSFDGTSIAVRQQKTKEPLIIPCHKILRAELDATARSGSHILVGERGNPIGAASLSVMVRRELKEMEVSGFSVHGLRKNAGNALAEAGCSTRQIMAVLGHRTPAMAMHYTKRAQQKKLARDAVDKWEAAESDNPLNVKGAKQ